MTRWWRRLWGAEVQKWRDPMNVDVVVRDFDGGPGRTPEQRARIRAVLARTKSQ